MVGECEGGNEPLGCIERWEILGFSRRIPSHVVVVVVVAVVVVAVVVVTVVVVVIVAVVVIVIE